MEYIFTVATTTLVPEIEIYKLKNTPISTHNLRAYLKDAAIRGQYWNDIRKKRKEQNEMERK